MSGNALSVVEFCLKCGTSEKDLISLGRFGCENCAITFRNAIPRFQNLKEYTFLCQYFTEFLVKYNVPVEKYLTDFMDILQGKPPSNHKFLPRVYRLRYSRSIKNRFYQPGIHEKEEIQSFIEQKIVNLPELSKRNHLIRNNRWYIYFFDEDHVRLEAFFTNGVPKLEMNIKKFLFSGYFAYTSSIGFISSCPTNCGRGNKLSVIMDFRELIRSGEIANFYKLLPVFIEIKDKKGIGYLDLQHSEAILYTKNFSNSRKNVFFGIVYLLESMQLILKRRIESGLI